MPDFIREFTTALRSLSPDTIAANLRNRAIVDYPAGLDVPDISVFLNLCAGTLRLRVALRRADAAGNRVARHGRARWVRSMFSAATRPLTITAPAGRAFHSTIRTRTLSSTIRSPTCGSRDPPIPVGSAFAPARRPRPHDRGDTCRKMGRLSREEVPSAADPIQSSFRNACRTCLPSVPSVHKHQDRHSLTTPRKMFSKTGSMTVWLSGTLTKPVGKGEFPAAVFVGGSGANQRDYNFDGHRLPAVVADYLTRRGFAVLRYDKRGVYKSTGNYAVATDSDFARDAAAAYDYLLRRADFDRRTGRVHRLTVKAASVSARCGRLTRRRCGFHRFTGRRWTRGRSRPWCYKMAPRWPQPAHP